jgi:uridylate kinase
LDETGKPEGDAEGASGSLSELGAVRRFVLKLSGESLAGEGGYGIDPESLGSTAEQVLEAVEAGAELAVVVGGGNIFRGSQVAD